MTSTETPAGATTPGGTADRSRRLQALLELLAAQGGRLSVVEAATALQVSEATVRRDFTALAQQRLVTRTHGGIVAGQQIRDRPEAVPPIAARPRLVDQVLHR